MEEALLADRIIVLDKGRLVKDGTAQQIFGDPAWLSRHGLDMPALCRIGSLLADEGYEQLRGIMHFDEFLDRLCE